MADHTTAGTSSAAPTIEAISAMKTTATRSHVTDSIELVNMEEEPVARRVVLACKECRVRKCKCDARPEGCSNCVVNERKCEYIPVTPEENLAARAKKRFPDAIKRKNKMKKAASGTIASSSRPRSSGSKTSVKVTTPYEKPRMRVRTRAQDFEESAAALLKQLNASSKVASSTTARVATAEPSAPTPILTSASAEAYGSPLSPQFPAPQWASEQSFPAQHHPVYHRYPALQPPFLVTVPHGPSFIDPFSTSGPSSYPQVPVCTMTTSTPPYIRFTQGHQDASHFAWTDSLAYPTPGLNDEMTSVCPLALSSHTTTDFHPGPFTPRVSHGSVASTPSFPNDSAFLEQPRAKTYADVLASIPATGPYVALPTPRSNPVSPTCLSPTVAQARTSYFPTQARSGDAATESDIQRQQHKRPRYHDGGSKMQTDSIATSQQYSSLSPSLSGSCLQNFAEGLQLDMGRPSTSLLPRRHVSPVGCDTPTYYGPQCNLEDDLRHVAAKIVQGHDYNSYQLHQHQSPPMPQEYWPQQQLHRRDSRLLPSLMPLDGLCTPPELASGYPYACSTQHLGQQALLEGCAPEISTHHLYASW